MVEFYNRHILPSGYSKLSVQVFADQAPALPLPNPGEQGAPTKNPVVTIDGINYIREPFLFKKIMELFPVSE